MSLSRALLFWIGCIGTRSLAAWVAYAAPRFLPYMGAIAAVIAAGFLSIYLGGLRTTGPEVFGARIWWNDLRPIHATLYGVFAYAALKGNSNAWIVLATDTLLGALAWVFLRL